MACFVAGCPTDSRRAEGPSTPSSPDVGTESDAATVDTGSIDDGGTSPDTMSDTASDVTSDAGADGGDTETGDVTAGCPDGQQDDDGDGTCRPTCEMASLDCSGHGSCTLSSGAPTCECEEGYTGSNCNQCASGYQDDDGDGTCEKTCQNASLTCNEGTCVISGGSPLMVIHKFHSPSSRRVVNPAGMWSHPGGDA